MRSADLSEADLHEANLSGAYFTNANLREAYLTKANLWSADLDGANFEAATVGNTIFGGVDLSSCSGLDAVHHDGPSTLGVDSIILSKGRIPEIFLRGVGLPDEWITYIPSLVGDGIQFFSCFISYSSADKPFAIRLHDALQSQGIRCWLDEKQLLPGDDISRELERGIHLWDKFLLCASKNSLTSWWVEDEIKTTLEKDRIPFLAIATSPRTGCGQYWLMTTHQTRQRLTWLVTITPMEINRHDRIRAAATRDSCDAWQYIRDTHPWRR